jgi:signal transduction histidine kinase/CHASE3 domain sensor protein/DNA-binding response OmpR family regulator
MKISKFKVSTMNVIIIGVLLFVGLSSLLSFRAVEKASDQIVLQTIPVGKATDNLLLDLLNQETGLRAYLISGDAKYLDAFKLGKTEVERDLKLIQNYANQNKNGLSIKLLIDVKAEPQIQTIQTYFENQIILVEDGKIDDARSRIAIGKTNMDKFRQINDELLSLIDKDTQASWAKTKVASKLSKVIINVGALLALVMGVVSGVLFHRSQKVKQALRESEGTYRKMAQNLEAQNEEIIAQQEEQEETLAKLTDREQELEWISSYQEKLTGFLELRRFLEHSIPALLEALEMDAALVLLKKSAQPQSFEIIYSCGYPESSFPRMENELFGAANRVFEKREAIIRKRVLTDRERGIHADFNEAIDQYIPLYDDKAEMIGFLLLTRYASHVLYAQKERLTKGLTRQFGLAFFTQLMNEERRQQSARLLTLNEELSGERDLIQRILESSHEGILMTDPMGIILVSNSRIHKDFNFKQAFAASIIDFCNYIGPHTLSSISLGEQVRAFIAGECRDLTLRFSYGLAEGKRSIELYATPVGDDKLGKNQGFLFVFRDRSEEERVDEMKNEFISIVSHELRTPLSSVLGFVEIMLDREVPADKQKKYLQTIYNEANRLSGLINDFLDLQRMESGQQVYHFVPVDIVRLMQEIAEQWRGKQAHRILLHVPNKSIYILGDADRLRQVFHNLISNAIKYSPSEDKVDVDVSLNSGKVNLQVTDYGLGIPEEAREKMFTKFYRVDNSDRRQIGGTGLGLAICKEIVDAHGGNITFVSEMKKGSRFTVHFQELTTPDIGGKIVILEDDDNMAKLIGETLLKLEIQTVHFRSAEESALALRGFEGESRPLLWIVDILLEGTKSGWDFLAELYHDPIHCATPVIVSSALEPPKNYYEKDAEKYLKKPFTMDRLIQVVQQLLLQDQKYTLVFPKQDEQLISMTLVEKGYHIKEMKTNHDMIEVALDIESNKEEA